MKALYKRIKTPLYQTSSGFTLVELIVSVSIIVLFSTIVLVNHAQFGSKVALGNLAYEVGLTIRQAQVFGISVQAEDTEFFRYAYGASFSLRNPQEFHLFRDSYPSESPNGQFDSSQEELIDTYTIRGRNIISDLCANTSSGKQCGLEVVDITFLRPDPDASFVTNPSLSGISDVEIYLESSQGLNRVVSVTQSGQISISNIQASGDEPADPPDSPTYTWQYQFYQCEDNARDPAGEVEPGAECFGPEEFGYVNVPGGDGDEDGGCVAWRINWYQCL